MATFPLPELSALPDALTAISNVDTTGLANATVATIGATYASAVDCIAACVEGIYADACWSQSNTNANVLTLCYQLAGLCVANAWYDIGQTDRGASIRLEMRRQLGDTTVTATQADRPAVAASYSLDPVPAPPAPPAPPPASDPTSSPLPDPTPGPVLSNSVSS